jgi:hypothetical protein
MKVNIIENNLVLWRLNKIHVGGGYMFGTNYYKIQNDPMILIKIKYLYNIRTLSVNIKFICTSFRNRQNSKPLASLSCLFRSEYKWILYLTTMYVYCVYPAMWKKSENLSDLDKKDRNKRHSSPFINVVKGVFFVVRVTLVPVSYLSVPSAVHSYRVPGKFIRRLKSLFV